MQKVVFVKAQEDWKLEVRFADGTRGIVPMKDRLFEPVFEPLKDPALFARVGIDEFGAICWPNGADLAPDAIYERLTAKTHVA
jgi:hypothetical protein